MTENNVETEYLEISKKNDWITVYAIIQKEALRVEKEEKFTQDEAKKPQNRKLNRYRDVNPYDHSRIILKRGSTNYINANLVKMEAANRQYILTQGPLPDTVGHFWLMVWEQNSRAVLMLNKILEKKQIKCHRYWPEDIGEEYNMELQNVGLSLAYLSHEDYSYFSKRIFRLTNTEDNTSREIIQFHYTTWPDFGTPASPKDFLEFLYKVRSSGVLEENVGPAVIHCSAGIGRSGTFCLVDCCLVLIERNGQSAVNVQNVLIGLRRYRTGLIQTYEQLQFSYEAIIEGAKKLQGQDSNCNDYEEVPISSSHSPRRYIEKEEDEEDEEPPPLPPPRGESLGRGGPPQVPSQTIPNTPSTRELTAKFLTEISDDKFNVKDVDNELSSETMQKSVDFSRPLPKIPNSESLDEFQSNYEYNDFYGNRALTNGEDEKHDSSNDISEASFSDKSDIVSTSDDSTGGKINLQVNLDTINAENIENLTRNKFKDEICPISKPLPPIPNNESEKTNSIENILRNTQTENIQPNADVQNLSKTEKEMFNKINSNKNSFVKENNVNLPEETEQDENQLPASDSATLRRRTRAEKQSVLAEKVREIKRKQQESERKQQSKRSRELACLKEDNSQDSK